MHGSNIIIKPKVEFDNRIKVNDNSYFDLFIGVLFVVNLLVSISIAFWTIGASDVSWNKELSNYQFSEKLMKQSEQCFDNNPGAVNNNGGLRALSVSLGPQESYVFTSFARYPQIPAVIISIVPIIAILWLILMKNFTTTITWLSLLMSIAMWETIGAFLLPSEVGIILCVIGGIIFLFYVSQYHKIAESITRLTTACVALSKNKDIIPATIIIKGFYFAYLVLFAFSIVNASLLFVVDPINCSIIQNRISSSIVWYQIFTMLWVARFSDTMRLSVTAMVVASWYFEQPTSERSSYPAFKSLKLITTKSIGTMSISSVIGAIADMLIRQLQSKVWFLDPVGCFLYLIATLCRQIILTVTTFTTISHAISSDSFFNSGKMAYDTLRRNFVGAFVNDAIGETVVKVNAYYISVALFFASWAWFDNVTGQKTLAPTSPDITYFIIVIAFIYLNRYPFFSLIIVNAISGFVSSPVLPALFISSIAHIILSYFGSVILDSMNTIFFCHAISKDNNLASNKDLDMKNLMEFAPMAIVLNDPGNGGQISYINQQQFQQVPAKPAFAV